MYLVKLKIKKIYLSIILLLIIYCTFSLINTNSKAIIKGVYIQGIDVSGLSKEEAKQKISNYINSSIPEEIKLKHNDFETSLSTSQLSIYFNTDEAIEIAKKADKALIIETLFNDGLNKIDGFFILIPEEESYVEIISRLGVE